jgi:hypothetical protein
MQGDERVLKAIARIESNGFQFAMRFEPHKYEARDRHPSSIIARIKGANKCSGHTASVIYSTSYGLYQIMGFNLYSGSSPVALVPVGEYMGNVSFQRESVVKFLEAAHLLKYSAVDLLNVGPSEEFTKAYNGPGNIAAYSAKLRNVLKTII